MQHSYNEKWINAFQNYIDISSNQIMSEQQLA